MLSVSACGSNNTASSSETVAQSAGNSVDRQDMSNSSGGDPSGQMEGEQADLRGEVSSISGNQVTLKLIEMPTFNKDNQPPQGDGKNAGDTNGAAKSTDEPKAADTTAAKPSDNPPKGDSPEGEKQPPQMSINYTGEEKTITIPNDITISSSGKKQADSEQKALSVSDIKSGNILQIWYSDEAKETISKVTVIESMPSEKNPSDKK